MRNTGATVRSTQCVIRSSAVGLSNQSKSLPAVSARLRSSASPPPNKAYSYALRPVLDLNSTERGEIDRHVQHADWCSAMLRSYAVKRMFGPNWQVALVRGDEGSLLAALPIFFTKEFAPQRLLAPGALKSLLTVLDRLLPPLRPMFRPPTVFLGLPIAEELHLPIPSGTDLPRLAFTLHLIMQETRTATGASVETIKDLPVEHALRGHLAQYGFMAAESLSPMALDLSPFGGSLAAYVQSQGDRAEEIRAQMRNGGLFLPALFDAKEAKAAAKFARACEDRNRRNSLRYALDHDFPGLTRAMTAATRRYETSVRLNQPLASGGPTATDITHFYESLEKGGFVPRAIPVEERKAQRDALLEAMGLANALAAMTAESVDASLRRTNGPLRAKFLNALENGGLIAFATTEEALISEAAAVFATLGLETAFSNLAPEHQQTIARALRDGGFVPKELSVEQHARRTRLELEKLGLTRLVNSLSQTKKEALLTALQDGGWPRRIYTAEYESVTDFDGIADEVETLIRRTREQSSVVFEEFPLGWLRALRSEFGNRVKLNVLRLKTPEVGEQPAEEILIAAQLVLFDPQLGGAYLIKKIGLDYDFHPYWDAYFALHHYSLNDALQHGATRIEDGPTSVREKSRLGYSPVRVLNHSRFTGLTRFTAPMVNRGIERHFSTINRLPSVGENA